MKNYVLIITMHADPAMAPGYDEWGGTHTYMKELLDELNYREVNCIMITRKAMEELPAEEQYNEHCRIYRLQNGDSAPMDKKKLILYHTHNLKEIQKIIDQQDGVPMIIHTVYWNSGRLGLELSKIYHIPFVHSVISNSRGRVSRGAFEPVAKRADYEQAIYEQAKWILCVSEDERNDIVQFYHIDPKKIIVAGQFIHRCFISAAHDENGFPRLNSTISTELQASAASTYNSALTLHDDSNPFWAMKSFSYFGRIDINKGVDHILCAWYTLYKKYRSDCPPLWLIGGSIQEIVDMRKNVSSQIPDLSKLEQEHKIVWWGCLDPTGASTLLLKTLVLVTNSLYEPGGRVVTEAMIEGVPVIAAPNGFAADLIKNWENGFLVEHGDEAGLAQRMEHFIRQPFLSNALGLSAKQVAGEIIRTWNFTDSHLWAYGLIAPPSPVCQKSENDFFSRREIHLFPYTNPPLSPVLLSSFFERNSGEKIQGNIQSLSTSESSSEIYSVASRSSEYIIKHPLSSLATSTLFNPLQKEQYVRDAGRRYELEKAAYQAHGEFIAGDSFHHLLLCRKKCTHVPHTNELASLLAFFLQRTVSLDQNAAQTFNTLLRCNPIASLESIDLLLQQLEKHLPLYHFGPACMFSPYVGWRLAPHLLAYNADILGKTTIDYLTQSINHFLQLTQLPSPQELMRINTDAQLRHLCCTQGKWGLVDLEKESIGLAEYEIADFLFDLICNQTNLAEPFWNLLNSEKFSQAMDKTQLLSSLAYHLFYDSVKHLVMGNPMSKRLLSILDSLRASS